ncbi:class II aldolase and adducin N-terminal domain-containing protein [Nitrosophilus alvini]|uniref:class II aldolase and adducin N-terminal domain-containing protein n=1 Tax=Nitrosophilus alvini TaxID=2714855 RepID=UPI00190C2810|nr:class II aldolase and adducin N-terminal domain-containing protein [Nitrosophilus alvini]
MNSATVELLRKISLSLFRKNFFGVYHGSISAKIEANKFIINKKEAIFDEIDENSLVELYFKKDYRWHDASIDAEIHKYIYDHINEAKFISYSMPPFITSYSLNYNKISPKDFFGKTRFGEITVYDPKNYDDWYERAPAEIVHHFQKNRCSIMVIKGYGIYTYDRDVFQMAKKIAILENSCKILLYSSIL